MDVDPAERRIATGSADNELRLYSAAEPDAEGAVAQRSYATPEMLCKFTQLVTCHAAAIP